MSKIKVINTSIEGLVIIEPTVFGDSRGYFMETFAKKKEKIKQINTCMENTLRDYKKVADIEFITPTLYNMDK